MVLHKKNIFGKTVAEAIQTACQELNVPQEELDIKVVETGSSGIFGLIRKKAHIKVAIKAVDDIPAEKKVASHRKKDVKKVLAKPKKSIGKKENHKPPKKDVGAESTNEEPLSKEKVELVRSTLDQLLNHMDCPSTIEMSGEGLSVHCQIESENEEQLTGSDGKTLDALQYLLRKMIARKIPDRLRLAVDIGDFRQKRLDDLREQAREMGEKVKTDGKVLVIPSLNPSERRVVHMELQNEKGVKSRSVGDGLFKKVLIYKPGKKRRPNRRRKKNPRSVKNDGDAKRKTE